MREINLLDWRREVREKKKKNFIGMFVAVLAVAAAVVFGVNRHYTGEIAYQESRNERLNNEIAALNRQIAEIKDLETERERLIARTDKIQQLQAGRSDIVHLVDDIVTTLPTGVFYTSIAQTGMSLTMQGKAQSNARVSTLMRRLNSSEYMDDAVLQEILAERTASASVPRMSSFRLTVKQARAAVTTDEDEG